MNGRLEDLVQFGEEASDVLGVENVAKTLEVVELTQRHRDGLDQLRLNVLAPNHLYNDTTAWVTVNETALCGRVSVRIHAVSA